MDKIKISIKNEDVKQLNSQELASSKELFPRDWKVQHYAETDSWTLCNSAGRVLFGSNLYEVDDSDWPDLIRSMQASLQQKGLSASSQTIEESAPWLFEVGKNIVIPTTISIPAVMARIKQAKVKAVWKMGNSRYFTLSESSNGEKVVFGGKYYQLTFYDKTKQMLQHGSREDKALAQKLWDNGKQIFRIEVRYCKASTLKRMLPRYIDNKSLCFYDLHSRDLFKKILIEHWTLICQSIPETADLSKAGLAQQISLGLQSGLSLNLVMELVAMNYIQQHLTHGEIRDAIVDKTLHKAQRLARRQVWYHFRNKMNSHNLPIINVNKQWNEAKLLITQQLEEFKPLRPDNLL